MRLVRVVHPFHPWSGREFELVQRRRILGEDRVLVRLPGGEVAALPAAWTDVVPPDPFVVMSRGLVPFRTEDLLAVADLLARLRSRGPGRDGPVKGILS